MLHTLAAAGIAEFWLHAPCPSAYPGLLHGCNTLIREDGEGLCNEFLVWPLPNHSTDTDTPGPVECNRTHAECICDPRTRECCTRPAADALLQCHRDPAAAVWQLETRIRAKSARERTQQLGSARRVYRCTIQRNSSQRTPSVHQTVGKPGVHQRPI